MNNSFLKVIVTLIGLTLSSHGAFAQNQPNILFICVEQHSFNYTGYAGHPYIKTPNLDELAKEGVVFNSAYAGAPVCTPSRASLMTGMYPSDVSSYGNSTVWDGTYPVWGTYFKDSGYYTHAIGKLDLDDTKPLGFESTPTDNGHKYHPDITELFRVPLCYRVGERDLVDGHSKKDEGISKITRGALDFITQESGKLHKPWLLYLGYGLVHSPFVTPEKYFNMYYPDRVDMPDVSEEELENMSMVYKNLRQFKMIATPISNERIKRARAGYYGNVTRLDDEIGQVIQSLKESGQYNNTIIIYTADHGESLGEHGLWLKNNLYDCAIRIPLIIEGPGIPANKRIDTPVAQVDLTPTILEHAGIKMPSYLRGQTLDRFFTNWKDSGDNVVYAENHSEGNCDGSFMIRKGDWKYIYFSHYPDLLFNLKVDPGEKINLADSMQYSSMKEGLKKELVKRVDPDKITVEAFTKQKAFLDSLVRNDSKEQLFNLLKGRLGEGQAKLLVEKLKGKI